MNQRDRKLIDGWIRQLESIMEEVEALRCDLEDRASNLAEYFPNKEDTLLDESENLFVAVDSLSNAIYNLVEAQEQGG